MLRKILFILNNTLCINFTVSASSRDMQAQFSSLYRLRQAQDFLENFEWTNEALRDLESVNINRTHTMQCRYGLVKMLYKCMRM